jgi:hypothetical protein
MMDERAVRALLGVMNLTAPFEAKWYAEKIRKPSELQKHKGVQQELRFWLLPDDYSEGFNGLISA